MAAMACCQSEDQNGRACIPGIWELQGQVGTHGLHPPWAAQAWTLQDPRQMEEVGLQLQAASWQLVWGPR